MTREIITVETLFDGLAKVNRVEPDFFIRRAEPLREAGMLPPHNSDMLDLGECVDFVVSILAATSPETAAAETKAALSLPLNCFTVFSLKDGAPVWMRIPSGEFEFPAELQDQVPAWNTAAIAATKHSVRAALINITERMIEHRVAVAPLHSAHIWRNASKLRCAFLTAHPMFFDLPPHWTLLGYWNGDDPEDASLDDYELGHALPADGNLFAVIPALFCGLPLPRAEKPPALGTMADIFRSQPSALFPQIMSSAVH